MICRICQRPCDADAAANLCAECAEIKAALKSYYGSLGGVDFRDRERVRAGALAIVRAHHRAGTEGSSQHVN